MSIHTSPSAPACDPDPAASWSDRPTLTSLRALTRWWPAPRAPRITLSLALFTGSLICAPFAPACWWLGHAELRGMADGSVAEHSRSWFRFLRGWGALWTLLIPLLLVLARSKS